MYTPLQFYFKLYKPICHDFDDWMIFAEAYANYMRTYKS